MLAGAEDVHQHPKRIDVRPPVTLADAVLLRGGKAGGAQDLGVGFVFQLDDPGGVKVDEHRLVSPEDHILRLHIPVDGSQAVEDP